MIRRPPRSTLDRSSAASDVYKRQVLERALQAVGEPYDVVTYVAEGDHRGMFLHDPAAVSYTHLRAHETVLDIVCRLLLEKKKTN